jgi:sec-independent protein translocase protein TatA
MFGLGMGELVIILVVVLLLFGAKKLPQLGKALGSSINNFKDGLKEGQKLEDKTDGDDKPEGKA